MSEKFWVSVSEGLPVVPEGEAYVEVLVMLYSDKYKELVTRKGLYFCKEWTLHADKGTFHLDGSGLYYEDDERVKFYAYIPELE